MAAVLIGGCKGSTDEEMPPTTEPTAVEFKGKPDPALAGVYKTSDGRSTYTFDASGAFELKGKVTTPGGSFDNDVKGSWTVDGDRMLFKYGQGNVVPYKMTKGGKTLKLALTGSMKRETVLVKQ